MVKKDYSEEAFVELFPELSFVLDKTLSIDELIKKTIEHGEKLRLRTKELEAA